MQTLERVRQDTIAELPSLSFSVSTPASGNVKFAHVVGSDPREEAARFCDLHYPAAQPDACANSMLESMQAAYEEGLQKHEAQGRRKK